MREGITYNNHERNFHRQADAMQIYTIRGTFLLGQQGLQDSPPRTSTDLGTRDSSHPRSTYLVIGIFHRRDYKIVTVNTATVWNPHKIRLMQSLL